ncbi:MAG: RNA methyltransferase [Pseudomonadota bacterium]
MKSTTPTRSRRDRHTGPPRAEPYWLYGIHAVRAALQNPRRTVHRLVVSQNAAVRLGELAKGAETLDVRAINKLVPDAVHQGAAAWVDPLDGAPLEDLAGAQLVVLLDHITDPHNVGAILRSAAAFRADGVVTTTRHSATETGVLAKSASGALDLLPPVTVTNLSQAVRTLQGFGFQVAALDSEAETPLDDLVPGEKWAFVLGAEGKGVRYGVAETCGIKARIEASEALASLNVSNAAAVALYEMRRRLLL